MLTMKIYKEDGNIFKDAKEAIKYMKETNFENEVSVYDINDKKAYEKTHEIYEAIKEYNKKKPLEEQILPSYPFGFRGILGCLGVQVYSIMLGTYKNNHNHISPFTGGFKASVLDTSLETPNIRPGMKALTMLAMIGGMVHNDV